MKIYHALSLEYGPLTATRTRQVCSCVANARRSSLVYGRMPAQEVSAYYREFVQLARLEKNSQFGANRTVVSVNANDVAVAVDAV